MRVARYEESVFILCECEKVIVAGIRGVAASRGRLFGQHGRRSKERDVFVGIVGADVRTQLRVAERPAELLEKRLGDDQLEVAGDPPGKKLSRVPPGERSAAIRMFGSRTARTQQRRRRVECCASTANSIE